MLYSLLEALNDDDSEIRDLAASIVSYIFWKEDSQPAPSMTSITAHRLLFQYIESQCTSWPGLLEYALARVLGLPTIIAASPGLLPPSSAERIATTDLGPAARYIEEILANDSVLFGEECQNLYKDNVQEIEHWAAHLISRQPTGHAWSAIYTWALHGLKAIEKASDPCGFSHRQEGFEAVYRVLSLARIAQLWSSDMDYLMILRDAILKAESQIGLAHQEHTKLISILKSHFEDTPAEPLKSILSD